MARFDLHKLPDEQGYVIDVQSNHASAKLRTRVVVPLIPLRVLGHPITSLNPIIHFDGLNYVFMAQSLATLTIAEMGQPVASLMAEHGDAFSYALDILLTGF